VKDFWFRVCFPLSRNRHFQHQYESTTEWILAHISARTKQQLPHYAARGCKKCQC
jgi:hypothetical protein